MKRLSSVAGLLALTLTLFACATTVKHVPGPDGEDARLISCVSTADCYAKADRVCPAGYVIRSSGTSFNVPGGRSTAFATRSEVLVSCKDDLPDPPSAAAGVPEREDTRVCEMAFPRAGDLATYWAQHTPNAKRLDEMPRERDFVSVCHEMPERVQRCFHAGYRTVHAKACDAVLLRLEGAERAKVDGLFLEAPGAGSGDGGG